MTIGDLATLEKQASDCGLLLRVKVRRPIGLWAFRLLVGKHLSSEKVQILGEMKAWAYYGTNGFQLDTMQVREGAPEGVGHLVWAGTMAWALEKTICKSARLLAIHDDPRQHKRLTRYFRMRGFNFVRDVGSAPSDLPLRLVWGGAGTLMVASCHEVYESSRHLWENAWKNK